MSVIDRLKKVLGQEKVFDRLVDRYALASDASFYTLLPLVVVRPDSVDEIESIFRISSEMKIPLTFRAAGTSLSGQAVTDGILVDLSRSWRNIEILSQGKLIKTEPGVVGAWANESLKPYLRKIGPDPASISSAMMGGIVANNSSGMCCGVVHNAYHTLQNLVAVLPSGFRFSLNNPSDEQKLLQDHPEIYNGLLAIRSKIFASEELLKKIRKKYLIKNTVGYSLNAFVDFDRPIEILAHLLVGSEGTLGFIAETTLHTIPAPAHKLTGLLFFSNVYQASAAVPSLHSAAAVELMDRESLRSVEEKAGKLSSFIQKLDKDVAALLVEFEFESMEALQNARNHLTEQFANLKLISTAQFTDDTKEQSLLWSLRKGLYPTVGSLRKTGSTVLIEDVAVPLEHLADLVVELQRLFKKYSYSEAVIFGHAKDGNIHFVITPQFSIPNEVIRYAQLMNEVVELVTKKFDGSLKGEHGTGRNMAPFIEAEWGFEARQIMIDLKRLIDPENICNPGVILSTDPEIHIQNLKSMPAASPLLDLCTECGYCESRCPSRDLTTTPRQRIMLYRWMTTLREKGDFISAKNLENEYRYDGIDTCATDGLCAIACPMGIDTGTFIKHLREKNHTSFANNTAVILTHHLTFFSHLLRLGIKTAHIMHGVVPLVNQAITHMKLIFTNFPFIPEGIRAPEILTPQNTEKTPHFIYFQTCISRTMGGYTDKTRSLGTTLLLLADRANIQLKLPKRNIENCCGMPFASKGYTKASHKALQSTISMLYEESQEGKLPIVVDISPCTYTLKNAISSLDPEVSQMAQKLQFLDSVEFASKYLLKHLSIQRKKKSIVLHPVCSLTKMGLVSDLRSIAESCADKVTIPLHAGCCGMAGDRGLIYPKLMDMATKMEKDEIANQNFDGFYSSSRTCEYGLSVSTKSSYHSILYLLEEASAI